ncbi:membrane protein [Vibrio vulnificus BAA87]|nr:membrane protein [Vibrio vulnificus BAA87]
MEKLMYLGFCFGNANMSIEFIGYVITVTAACVEDSTA